MMSPNPLEILDILHVPGLADLPLLVREGWELGSDTDIKNDKEYYPLHRK